MNKLISYICSAKKIINVKEESAIAEGDVVTLISLDKTKTILPKLIFDCCENCKKGKRITTFYDGSFRKDLKKECIFRRTDG